MDGSLLETINALVIDTGPWIVYLVTMLETAAFIGLLIPSGPTILFAAFLASTDFFRLEYVIAATLLGGFSGDQIGYWMGRRYGTGKLTKTGRIGRLWARHEKRAETLFRQHSVLAVSLARCIAFVRTIMPWFAGMTRMPYRRFLTFEIAGVLVWGGAHVTVGYVAGQSWQLLARALGSATLALGIFVAAGATFIAYRRKRRAAHSAAGASRPLFRVALTGNIASGKTTVAEEWRRLGASIVDADELARDAVAPGSATLAAVAARFGPGVVAPDGTLDRAALRARVFGDDTARSELESILHPEIERLRVRREAELRADGACIVVHVIPLLFEVGMEGSFDAVVFVDAAAETRRQRLIELRGLDAGTAERMMAAQLPAEEKRARSSIVIDNNGTAVELTEQARAVWQQIEDQAGALCA